MKQSSQILFWWTAAGLYCGLIFCLSSLSRPPILLDKYNFDKGLHGVEYGILGALFLRALHATFQKLPARALLWAALFLASLYGASDEWHQSFVPGRNCSFFDWTADTLGAFVGAWLALKMKRKI